MTRALQAFSRRGFGGNASVKSNVTVDEVELHDPFTYMLVADYNTRSVHRYDVHTGAFVDVFISSGSGGMERTGGMAFGPDKGHLYATSTVWQGDNEVLRYDRETGDFIDVFIPAAASMGNALYNLSFGPDGDLYILDWIGQGSGCSGKSTVRRYDGETGVYIDDFAEIDHRAHQMEFGPDGDLYVAYYCAEGVVQLDRVTGDQVDTPVAAFDSRFYDLAFSPVDGDLLISAWPTDALHRYDGGSYDYSGTFGSVGSPGYLQSGDPVGAFEAKAVLLLAQRVDIRARGEDVVEEEVVVTLGGSAGATAGTIQRVHGVGGERHPPRFGLGGQGGL